VRRGWLLLFALVWVALVVPIRGQVLSRFEPVRCVVTVSTATTITAVGGDCAAKPNQALWITDILSSTNAAGIAADSYNTLKYGTGTTCGTGTTVIWFAFTAAATQATVIDNRLTPIRLPQNVDLCWINSTAGSKAWVITGYLSS
jgi:hypothetical protein